ncbi:MAG: F0F1 ATP synthase subunit B [Gammaproteobacteria bacterium]|nr:F0F1 ATP synthase subunit B [Gammaproteobacteria bacterium]
MDFNATLIGQTIAMIVFVWFCMKYIWPPILESLEQRRKDIADGLAAGERAQEDLVKAKAEAAGIIDEARGQALDIVDQANKRGTSLVEEARDEGRRERERQLGAARSEIEQERNRVREELRGQVSAIAVASAEKILQREINPDVHRDILGKLANEI